MKSLHSALKLSAPQLLRCFTVLCALATFATAQERPLLQLVSAPGSPTVDGQVESLWLETPAVQLVRSVAAATRLEREKWPKSIVRCLWDHQHLYVLAQISDNTQGTKAGAPWEQDSFEILLDENLGRTRSYQPDDLQIRVSRAGNLSGTDLGQQKVLKFAVNKSDDGYLVEMSIAWRYLKPNTGSKIGIDFQVNDDPGTGRRAAILKWSDESDESWRDTSRFGTLLLGTQRTAAEVLQESGEAVENSASSQGKDKSQQLRDQGQSAFDATQVVAQLSSPKPLWDSKDRVPDWVADAVVYQLFPERFRNGDPTNDPTRLSLEFPDVIPDSWQVTPWTQQWYRRSAWELQMGSKFYDDGVFHRRYGGDLQGVLEKMDYLAHLGVNVIYFNPVFYARSLHKYDGNSFHHVDPHFGPDPEGDFALMQNETSDPATWQWTAADRLFLEVLKQSGQRGIRVIIDGVFNHTGRDFFAFADILTKQQKSPYVDWYVVKSFDDPTTPATEFRYSGWWGVDTLPEFANSADGNDLHPGPKAYIFDATRRWMDPNGDGDPSDGISGWRLDVANEVPNQFWRDWHVLVRSINPQAYTVAEIWDESSGYLAECGFSSTMNYHGFAYPVKGFLIDGRLAPSQFAESFISLKQLHDHPVQFGLLNLVDSHDTDRLASMIVNARRQPAYHRADRFDYDVGEAVSPRHNPQYDTSGPSPVDRQIQRLVALFQFTVPGAPMIYYGTEAGMFGGDDPDDRMPMVWDDLQYEAHTLGAFGQAVPEYSIAFDHKLYDYYRRLIQMRSGSPALRRGDYRNLLADDQDQTLLFCRRYKQEVLLIAINRSKQQSTVNLNPADYGLPVVKQMSLVFSTGQEQSTAKLASTAIRTQKAGLRWQLPALTGQVWKLDMDRAGESK